MGRISLFAVLVVVLMGAVFLLSPPARAVDDMVYTGLFRDKGRFKIDGRNVFLKQGERGPNGAELVSAEKSVAIVSMEGKIYAFKSGGSEPRLLDTTVALARSSGGGFFVRGTINGAPTAFLVDTGASYVSMNSDQARQLKINYRRGERVEMSTAAKRMKAYLVTLDSVRVEGIIVKNVRAAVIPGNFPEITLLGNSFLQHIKIEQSGKGLIMTQK